MDRRVSTNILANLNPVFSPIKLDLWYQELPFVSQLVAIPKTHLSQCKDKIPASALLH